MTDKDEGREFMTTEEALAQPTPDHEVHFFPQAIVGVKAGDPKALCVPYFRRQFVEDRLDDVVGSFGWQADARAEAGVLLFGIGIHDPDSGLWIWKWDTGAGGSSDPANESLTGGIKRAGRLWGIGRDISRLESKWRKCFTKKRNGKHVFNGWTEPPSVAELRQYSTWLRRNRTGTSNLGDDEEHTGEAQSESSSGSGSGTVKTDDGMRIGADAQSQFWHMAKKLKADGTLSEDDIASIIESNKDESGNVDFVEAKADLDMKVPF